MVVRFISRAVDTFIQKWPGKKYFGVFRFLPIFFVLGATLEFSMVNWTVRETNFYTVYKRKQIHNQALAELKAETEAENNASGRANLMSMFLGAQIVHYYYKPLQDMDALVKAEKERIVEERAREGQNKNSETTQTTTNK